MSSAGMFIASGLLLIGSGLGSGTWLAMASGGDDGDSGGSGGRPADYAADCRELAVAAPKILEALQDARDTSPMDLDGRLESFEEMADDYRVLADEISDPDLAEELEAGADDMDKTAASLEERELEDAFKGIAGIAQISLTIKEFRAEHC